VFKGFCFISPLGLAPFIEKKIKTFAKVRSTDTVYYVIFKDELNKNQSHYSVSVLRTLENVLISFSINGVSPNGLIKQNPLNTNDIV
jgi:hypothetical protein